MYLGGPEKQPLLRISEDLHKRYHAGLDRILPRSAGSKDWSKLSPQERQGIIDILRDYNRRFDATYGTDTSGALEMALKSAGAVP
jgi:hypothetical protein